MPRIIKGVTKRQHPKNTNPQRNRQRSDSEQLDEAAFRGFCAYNDYSPDDPAIREMWLSEFRDTTPALWLRVARAIIEHK